MREIILKKPVCLHNSFVVFIVVVVVLLVNKVYKEEKQKILSTMILCGWKFS